jgi:hypothetical protein
MTTKRDMWRVTSDEIPAGLRVRHSCHASPVARHPQQGMALVITLILLSVTLIMAVAFLSISRREREAVSTTTDSASARLAADAALANAEAQIVANIFATTNSAAYNFGLLVSTNYFNTVAAPGVANPTNVNYDSPGLTSDQRNQALADLFYSARAPVYLTNYVFHTNENRFYLDLNRNGMDDPNGFVTNVDQNGNFILDSSRNPIINFQIGDPEWIGVLDHPDMPHGPNNRFVARYAFVAVPVGNTLDLNAIHNQVLDEPSAQAPGPVHINPGTTFSDGFFRNEGVGSWEINLAAFLADLNANEWGQSVGSMSPAFPLPPPNSANFYQYDQVNNLANSGVAFDDARALLAYRYANDYKSLASVNSLFGGPGGLGGFAFQHDSIDGYSDGLLMTGFQLPGDVALNDDPSKPWAGADNTNQFFTPEELFDTNKTGIGATYPGFSDRLLNAGTNTFGGSTVPTYDRYTFYRMLDELGSDSTPESGKMNVNYDNLDPFVAVVGGNTITNAPASTNFMKWQPLSFFAYAADRLLRLYSTNWFRTNPSNYLFTYYGIATNYYYANSYGNFVTNDPNGLGLTNIPFFGMTNQIPAFGITNIPVWANGQFVYTPAVNRQLQLAANIYDTVYYTSNYFASLNPGSYPGAYLPNVFRPFFSKVVTPTTTNVFICGFNEVTNAYEADLPLSIPYNLANPSDLANLATTLTTTVTNHINVFGVPMIIGAKKGFPNFNEFYMENAFQLTRKLMVTRQSTNVPSPVPSGFFAYYEMFNLSLNSRFGMECWNSYRSNYTRPIDIYVTNFLSMTLTNDENNFSFTTNLTAGSSLSFGPSIITNLFWPGYTNSQNPVLSAGSFQVPLETNFAAIPVSMYRFNDPSVPGHLTTNLNLTYEMNIAGLGFGQFPVPHWGMTVTNNLQVAMVDHDTGRLIDYVQLSGPNSVRDLTAEILSEYDTDPNNAYHNQWNTNLYNNVNNVPIGFSAQYAVSQGKENPISWTVPDDKNTYDAINGFRKFTMGSSALILTYPRYVPDQNTIGAAEMTNAMQMPYTPTALVVQDIVWQANDPLVHYLSTDLNNPAAGSGLQITTNWPGNLGIINQRYQPWGGNPGTGVGTNLLAVKDPLVTCSDDWNFPTNKFPTVGWLGRVHRGTPWQTVYLKASDILSFPNNFGSYGFNGPNLWVDWTGDMNSFDFTNTAPKQDRLLFDVFTTAFNDNATRGTLSVNQPHLAAWSALFSGVMVLSNNASDVQVSGQTASLMTNYTAFPISPAGPGTTNSAMWQLWNGISQARASVSNTDGVIGAFEHAGDILFVPQLSERSPFLNWNSSAQYNSGISDEMYEWLPQQVMSLLRDGPPRYVIYCYGQALKPAADSLVTSGANFGMCTNYQVVAESAARAVVRVEGAGTSAPHVVVESFNPLPPD